MVRSGHAVHRTIVVVDVAGFGDARRTLPHQLGTRAGLYRVVADALRAAGVRWAACYHEDRGDAVFVLVPPRFAKGPLLEVMPAALARALHRHNDTSPAAQRIRVRVAVHAGEVAFDDHGVTATALTTAFRMLDAPPVRQALVASSASVALVVSRWIFDEVVRHSAVLDATTFRPVPVEVKEAHDTAWVALPDHPYPADPDVLASRPGPATTGGGVWPAATPRQLPAAPASFVGRDAELAALDHALTAATSPSTAIATLGGAGGIGKTWLALHWAHRNAHRFPDGQLFVDLRGFSPDSDPLRPATAVRRFLDALGVEPGRLPTDLDAQAALYRSLVADRRMLVVLDNAANPKQVGPLLPGAPRCVVLVTSRTRFASLVERHDACHLHLGVLSQREARASLAGRLGPGRVAAEPAAVDELIALCGGYPVALSIAARHAATHPDIPLAELAAELRDLGLELLDDDPGSGLPAVLSWSLRHLSDEERTVFALLGIAPGPDIGLPAAVSLTGLAPASTRTALRALENASLVDRRLGGRYAMHDLVRGYAATVARQLPEAQRRAALARVVDFSLRTAHTAHRLLAPHSALAQPEPSVHTGQSIPLPDEQAALAWLDVEHPHLLAAQRIAAAQRRYRVVCQLARTLTDFHLRRGHRHDDLACWQAALTAATHLRDPDARTDAHRYLGRANSRLGRHDEAIGHLHHALALAERHRNATQQAHTHYDLGVAWGRQKDDRKALEHDRRALDLYRGIGNPVWVAAALNAVGWDAACLGDHDSARRHCQAALVLYRQHQDTQGEAATLDSLGWIDHQTGRHHQAVQHYRAALALLRTLGHAYEIAAGLDSLGHPHQALGEHQLAGAAWHQALALYREQGRTEDAERVQRQLDELTEPSTGKPLPTTATDAGPDTVEIT